MIKIQNSKTGVLIKIDTKIETENIIAFLRKTMKESGFEKIVIGVSGGVDSGTALILCVRALGKENVLAALLPCGELNREGLEDAQRLFEELRVPKENIVKVDIKPMVDNFQTNNLDRVRVGNVMARVRMIFLFDLAKKYRALVCGTENRSEYLLGYYTRFGDEASDIEPIRHLYKTQVLQLARFLGIPEEIIKKPATAGLWEGQTDETELGFTYLGADETLYQVFDKNVCWDKIKNQKSKIKNIDQKLNFKKREEIVNRIRKRVDGNWFKKGTPRSLEKEITNSNKLGRYKLERQKV